MRLNTSSASALPLATPQYDRQALTAGIAHIGVGGFHRAHQAVYLDEICKDPDSHFWAIHGIGIMPGDVAMRDALAPQEYLYTLMTRHPDGTVPARVIGSLIDMSLLSDSLKNVLGVLTDPAIRIVSLTITEGGYPVDVSTGKFTVAHPAVQADHADPRHPASAIGLIVEALRLRFAAGTAPFTVMSCDNMQGNGDRARAAVLGFAALLDPGLASLIDTQVTFPNSMVDRITPATTDADRQLLADQENLDDEWPVVAEPFSQWVIEDRFCNGRPQLDRVGVQLVADVDPYEQLKLRLLNGSHQALGHLATQCGYTYVDEAMSDPVILAFVRAYLTETVPSLEPVAGIDLEDYQQEIVNRFSNPHMRDAVDRLRTDASDRVPLFVLPGVRKNLKSNRSIAVSATIVELWRRGVVRDGDQVLDRRACELVGTAVSPATFCSMPDVFGPLSTNPDFIAAVHAAAERIDSQGLAASIASLR